MKEASAFSLPCAVAKAALYNNIDKWIGKAPKTKFQIFIELAFGMWCCMMLVTLVKYAIGISEPISYPLGIQIWFFYMHDYTIFNQHMSRL